MRKRSLKVKDQIISYVNDYYMANSRTPSTTEIAREIGHSRSTAYFYLVEMDREGMIGYSDGAIHTDLMDKQHPETVPLPIAGHAVCGEPVLAEQNIEEYVNLPARFFSNGNYYMLWAYGESMVGAGIDPGDLLIVRQQETANEGEVIVALTDNESTVKRLFFDNETGEAILHPENPDHKKYPDIRVRDLRVQGVVKNVVKQIH